LDPHQYRPETSPSDINLRRRLGSYELLERIGEGGMGVVYRARHVDSGDDLAIKLIKRGMDTDSVLRRFHNERRILETLNHPNIAKVLDAGATPEGLPYFVMEYIPGQPISQYCDINKLSIEARLKLFEKVCAAVKCAHESHIVHRDIKPENILVTADGEPKLLDFGIAKVLDIAGPTQDATLTIIPVMTPHYASPEQARGASVNASSDIYSLGVLLYELLAGCSPYRTAGGSAASYVHAIAYEHPPRPSATIAQFTPADPKSIAIAANRSTGLTQLRTNLLGDLDAIVLTALDKEPTARYRTVAAFSADIRRHLEGTRVNVRKLNWRLSHLSSRTRRAVALTAMAVVVCATSFGVFYRIGVRTTLNVRPSVAVLGFQNLSNQPSAEWLSTALTEMLSTELSAGGRLRTVPGELVSRVKVEMALPNLQTLTKPTLGRLRDNLSADYVVVGSYLALGEGSATKVRLDLRLQDTRNGEVVASASETRTMLELENLVTNAGTVLRRQLGAGGVGGTESASVRGSMPDGAEAARNYSEGLERLRTFDTLGARELLRNAVKSAPAHAPSHAALAAASGLLGYDVEAREEAKKALDLSAGLGHEEHLSIEGRYFETMHAWDKAVVSYQTLRAEFPDNLEYGLRLAAAETQAGDSRRAIQTLRALRVLPSAARDPRVDLAEAEAYLAGSDLNSARDGALRAAQSGASQGMRILSARSHLIACRIALESGDPQGALSEAAQSQQLYLAVGHRQGVAWALNETAGVLTQRGDVAGARARYEEALAVCRTTGDQSCIGTDLDSLGVLRRRQGDLRGALAMHQEALEIRRSVGDRAGVATSLYNLGNVLEIIGDLPRAHQAAAEALEIRLQLGERRSAALTMSRLANISRREGDLNQALKGAEEALTSLKAIGDRGGVAMAQFNLGVVLFDRGDLGRSRSVLTEAVAVRREQHDKNNLAQATAGLARVALAEDRLSEATTLIAESISLRQELGEINALAESNLIHAEILLEQDKAAAAEKAARDAAATFRHTGAWGREGDSSVVIARVQLARGNAPAARETLAAAEKYLSDTKDARLRIWRDRTQAAILHALDRNDEAATALERALAESRRLGFLGMTLETQFAGTRAGISTAPQLVTDAQQAGFLLIARKARE
jgi:serine/threonine protein kinase/tetratricopeptide (TPR) repeat protein